MIFRAKGKRGSTAEVPAPCEGIAHVTTLTMLGVVVNEQMTAADHVSSLLTTCSRLSYALRVLHKHGIPAASISDVFRATVLVKLMYYATAWAGFTSAADRARLGAFSRRCRRLGYCNQETPAITELFDSADDALTIQQYPEEQRSRNATILARTVTIAV